MADRADNLYKPNNWIFDQDKLRLDYEGIITLISSPMKWFWQDPPRTRDQERAHQNRVNQQNQGGNRLIGCAVGGVIGGGIGFLVGGPGGAVAGAAVGCGVGAVVGGGNDQGRNRDGGYAPPRYGPFNLPPFVTLPPIDGIVEYFRRTPRVPFPPGPLRKIPCETSNTGMFGYGPEIDFMNVPPNKFGHASALQLGNLGQGDGLDPSAGFLYWVEDGLLKTIDLISGTQLDAEVGGDLELRTMGSRTYRSTVTNEDKVFTTNLTPTGRLMISSGITNMDIYVTFTGDPVPADFPDVQLIGVFGNGDRRRTIPQAGATTYAFRYNTINRFESRNTEFRSKFPGRRWVPGENRDFLDYLWILPPYPVGSRFRPSSTNGAFFVGIEWPDPSTDLEDYRELSSGGSTGDVSGDSIGTGNGSVSPLGYAIPFSCILSNSQYGYPWGRRRDTWEPQSSGLIRRESDFQSFETSKDEGFFFFSMAAGSSNQGVISTWLGKAIPGANPSDRGETSSGPHQGVVFDKATGKFSLVICQTSTYTPPPPSDPEFNVPNEEIEDLKDRFEMEIEDLEDEIEDIIDDIEEVEKTIEEVEAEARRSIVKLIVDNITPECVTFEPSDLVPSKFFAIQGDPVGSITVERGIFILPADPDDDGYSPSDPLDLLDLNEANFSPCVVPQGALDMDNYRGFRTIPFQVNIGSTFVNWTTLGISKNTPTPYVFNELENLKSTYVDGAGAITNRPPHPLDHYYAARINSGRFEFRHLTYHSIRRFFEAKIDPENYYLDYWGALIANGSYANVLGASSFSLPGKVGVRSKDMYLTLGSFLHYQDIPENFPVSLEKYTVNKTFLPNATYDGTAGLVLRIFPGFRKVDQGNAQNYPRLRATPAARGGGAFYVQASYPEADVTNFDVSLGRNAGLPAALFSGEAFSGHYHHDMYHATNDQHLRPTTFIHAVLKGAGITPTFQQQGADVDGDINDHKMQLIENTSVTYRQLIQRVLPGLGYILRNAQTGDDFFESMELVDIATKKFPTFQFGDNMLKIMNIEYDSTRQYSSYIFENKDMVRGNHTLEEFDNNPLESGRYAIFNSNIFVNGRTLTIPTGTWTSEFRKVATLLSLRQDRYTFRVTNFFLLEKRVRNEGTPEEQEYYIIIGPNIGDRVKLKSYRIPNRENEIDLLIVSITQTEAFTEYQGIHFAET